MRAFKCSTHRPIKLSIAAWTLTPSGEGYDVQGMIQVRAHYFEDGNVQLDDKAVFQCEIPATPSEVGSEFVAKVREQEQAFMAKLEYLDIVAKKSFSGGARVLPC